MYYKILRTNFHTFTVKVRIPIERCRFGIRQILRHYLRHNTVKFNFNINYFTINYPEIPSIRLRNNTHIFASYIEFTHTHNTVLSSLYSRNKR